MKTMSPWSESERTRVRHQRLREGMEAARMWANVDALWVSIAAGAPCSGEMFRQCLEHRRRQVIQVVAQVEMAELARAARARNP